MISEVLSSRGPFSESARRQLASDIVATVRAMPSLMRRSFELARYRGRTVAEISSELGMSPEDVRALLRCGELRISRSLAPWSGVRPETLPAACSC